MRSNGGAAVQDISIWTLRSIGVTCLRDFGPWITCRDWLPNSEGHAGSRGSRTSRWWRSSGRRIGIRFRCGQAARVSEQTIYTWRKRFGTFQADDVRRLKQLEHENARLKKLVAERDLEIEVMKEINAKNGERAGSPWPGGVRDGQGLSQRRACTLVRVGRSALPYRSRNAVKTRR